jgi:hemolysin activation/secretion protein
LSFYTTADFQEQQILQFGHDFRIGSDGLTVAGQFTYAWTEPDIGAAAGAARIKAETLFASVEASYPLIRRQSASLRVAAGLEFIDQDIRFIGPLATDRLRVGYVRLDGDAIDFRGGQSPNWRLRGSLEFRQGLNILGASKRCDIICLFTRTPPSRFDGDPTSSVVRFEGEGELAIADDLSFYVRPMAQYAFDRVFSFEEFSGGNYSIGRGYEPGVITGENGAAIQFELRGARYQPLRNNDITVQPFVFADAAWAWDDSRTGANDPHRLLSVGGGVRSNLSDRFRLDMTVAAPTRRAGLQPSKGPVRFLLSLTAKLLPWR